MILQDPDKIYDMDIEELWNTYKTLIETEEEVNIKVKYKKEIDIIENGEKIKIPIYYLTRRWYMEYPKSRCVTVKGFEDYNIVEFMEDMQKRKDLLRKIILETLPDEEFKQPRG